MPATERKWKAYGNTKEPDWLNGDMEKAIKQIAKEQKRLSFKNNYKNMTMKNIVTEVLLVTIYGYNTQK